jgi:hypothetical protein
MIPSDQLKNRGPRILTMGLDRSGAEPKILVHIVDEKGGRRGTLDDAQEFIRRMAADFAPEGSHKNG